MVRFSNKNIVAATSSDDFGDIDFYTSDKQRLDTLGGTQRWRENLLEAVMNYTATSPAKYGTSVETTDA